MQGVPTGIAPADTPCPTRPESAAHDGGNLLKTRLVEQLFQGHEIALAVSQRDTPVRILVVRARLVLRTLFADRVDDGGGHELAWRAFEPAVQRIDDLVLVGELIPQGSLVEIPLLDEHVQHGVVLGGRGGLEFLHWPGQQAQLLT